MLTFPPRSERQQPLPRNLKSVAAHFHVDLSKGDSDPSLEISKVSLHIFMLTFSKGDSDPSLETSRGRNLLCQPERQWGLKNRLAANNRPSRYRSFVFLFITIRFCFFRLLVKRTKSYFSTYKTWQRRQKNRFRFQIAACLDMGQPLLVVV